MGCYLMCEDGLGRCMSIFVYIIMLLGHFVYFISVVKPALGTDEEQNALIEYACYGAVWLLMLFSHILTMCVDPGFIPKKYTYDEQVLAAPFSTLAAAETAIKNQNRIRDVQDDEERIKSLSLEMSGRSGSKRVG